MQLDINTYIFAGGNSTRMGSDKALLKLGAKFFVDHVCENVAFLNSPITLVSSKKQHHKLNYNCINDIQINKGPVGAMVSALKNTTSEWNLILSCDTPLLKQEFIEWLINHVNGNYDATIGVINERKMALLAVYKKSCLPVFEKHLNENQLKVMTVLKELNVNYLHIPKKFHAQLTNINTPSQLKAVVLEYSRK